MKISLTKHQWERISEITGNGGLLICSSIIIPFLLDKADLPGVIRSLAIAMFLWYISLQSARKY